MAFPRLLPVSSISAVAAGAIVTIRPGADGTYYGMRFRYQRSGVAATTGQIASDIDLIRVFIDNIPQWELTGAQLQMINAKNGILPDNGEIPLHFSEIFRKTEGFLDYYAWGMNGIKDFTIEITINASAPSPTLQAYRSWSSEATTMGEIRKFRRSTMPVSVSGVNTYTDLRPTNRVLGYHCNTSIITDVKIKIAEQEVLTCPLAELHSTLKEQGFVPISGWSHLAFDGRNRIGEGLQPFILSPFNGQNNAAFPITGYLPFELVLTTNAATPFTMIHELRGPRD